MRDKAVFYYNEGYNCSQCILKAAEYAFQIPISRQCYSMCSTISTGFGTGGMCSVLVAGFMVFGLLFDEETAKRLRIRLITLFQEKYDHINCSQLKQYRDAQGICSTIVGDTAEMIYKIILQEKK